MDNSGYEADEKGSVHLQSIKRIKENDNLKVRQPNYTYTNKSLNSQDRYLYSTMLFFQLNYVRIKATIPSKTTWR